MEVSVTHIDDFQLPEVFNTVQGVVVAGQEVGQVLQQTQIFQPGGQGVAAVTAQRFHLCESRSAISDALKGSGQ